MYDNIVRSGLFKKTKHSDILYMRKEQQILNVCLTEGRARLHTRRGRAETDKIYPAKSGGFMWRCRRVNFILSKCLSAVK